MPKPNDTERTTLLGSASQLFRSLECPASGHLPQSPKPPHVQRAADRGTALHLFAQHAPEGVEQALEQVPAQYHAECRQMDPERLPHKRTPLHYREIAFAHHGETGAVRELLCEGGARDYGDLEPAETPGTLDVGIRGFYMAEVWDLKTGRTPVPPPAINPQLLHGALCVSETLAPMAQKFVLGIQPVLPGGTLGEPDAAVVDRWDLEEHAGRIRVAQRKALRVVQAVEAGEQPEVYPGPWCRYCGAEAVCPKERR